MAFDGIALYGIINELKEKVCGSRIDRIYQNTKNELIFFLRHPQKKEYKLLISANSSFCRLHLTKDAGDNPKTPPMFCMLLRKHLSGGRINSITQKGLERIVEIKIQNTNEFMEVVDYSLIIEIMGRHSNIILLKEADNTILDSIKRVTFEINRYRQILPGEQYIDPPVKGKANLLEKDNINSLILANSNKTLSRWIIQNFAGFSGSAAKEIAFRADIPHEKAVNTLDQDEVIRLSRALDKLKNEMKLSQFKPYMYLDENSLEPIDFWVFPLSSKSDKKTIKKESINDTVDLFYKKKINYNKLYQTKNTLKSKLTKILDRYKKNLGFIKTNHAKTEEMEKYRIWGEVLSAYLYKIRPCMKEVKLPNFYDNEKEIIIPLDPKLDPAQNAQKFFSRYKKLQSAKTINKSRIEAIYQEINYLENTLVNIENSENLGDLIEIEQELKLQGYIKTHKNPRKNKPSEPLKFTSTDGFTIYVGKNNRQNDLITKRAKPDDIWLHAKDIPGSHVIIKCNGKKVTQKAILEASILAAYYSKSRNGSNVPVDNTYVKNVKKPSGSKPGFVIYFHQKTLFVTPDRKIVEKLSL